MKKLKKKVVVKKITRTNKVVKPTKKKRDPKAAALRKILSEIKKQREKTDEKNKTISGIFFRWLSGTGKRPTKAELKMVKKHVSRMIAGIENKPISGSDLEIPFDETTIVPENISEMEYNPTTGETIMRSANGEVIKSENLVKTQ